MTRIRRHTAVFAALAIGAAAPAFAQQEEALPEQEGQLPPEEEGLPNDRNSLTIGIGGAYVPSYEGSDNYILTPIGIVLGKVGGISFATRGTSLSLDLIPSDPNDDIFLDLGPTVNVRLDRTSRIRDPQVRALGEIDTAIEVGGYGAIGKNGILHQYDSLTLRLTYQHDVTDTHDSGILIPSIEYGTPLSERTFVQLGLSGERVGDGYGLTYFSVSPAGAIASGLPAYVADGGWKNYRLSLFGAQVLTGDLRRPGVALFGGVSYSKVLGDFKRSPIVAIAGDADQYLATLGISYTF